MASERKMKYIYELPYHDTEKLCKLLDLHEKWKSLGGYMNFSTLDIQSVEHVERWGKSPSYELLTKWGQQNHTVEELFVLLSKMQHFQAMVILKPFVHPQFHPLLFEGEESRTKLLGDHPQFPECLAAASSSADVAASDNKTFGGHNLNVKINKPSSSNSEKIQNRNPFSAEDNIPLHDGKSSPKSPLPPRSRAGGPFEQIPLSPAGIAALYPGSAAIAQVQLNIEVPTSSMPERKLSYGSMASTQSEYQSVLPMHDYKEMQAATNDWCTSNILGKGGFGTVFKGVWKNTDVAIKRIDRPKGESRESQEIQFQQTQRELQVLQAIRHPNILQLYSFSFNGNEPCLVYEYMVKGSVEDRLQCRNGTAPLTWPQRYNIAEKTAKGLQFMHTVQDKPLIHGDIKSANILLDSNFEPKIGDFGLAREGPQTQYTHMKVSKVHGTRPYLPDEFLRSKKLSTKVDTYSFGVVLFELATGLRAYDDKRENKYLREEVIKSKGDIQLMDPKAGNAPAIFASLIDLGVWCVQKLPKDRPEMIDVWKKLDQHPISVTPASLSPLDLQLHYDHLQQRRQSNGSGTQVPFLVSSQPSNSVTRHPGNLSNHPLNGHNITGQPPSAGNQGVGLRDNVANGQFVQGESPLLNHPSNRSPANQQLSPISDRCVSPKIGNGFAVACPSNVESSLPTVLPAPPPSAALQIPLQAPAISFMPPTGSELSDSSSQSSFSESSIYSSHVSHLGSTAVSKEMDRYQDQVPDYLPRFSLLNIDEVPPATAPSDSNLPDNLPVFVNQPSNS